VIVTLCQVFSSPEIWLAGETQARARTITAMVKIDLVCVLTVSLPPWMGKNTP
jgi:hypothetical protein